jgi:uncharacterized membrane protein
MEFEDIIGYTLRIGVILSILFLITGLSLIFISGQENLFQELINLNSNLNSKNFRIEMIISNLISLGGIGFIYFGLIILIATPISRVFLGILQFYKERNWIYFIITLIVFFNIIFSIFFIPYLISL